MPRRSTSPSSGSISRRGILALSGALAAAGVAPAAARQEAALVQASPNSGTGPTLVLVHGSWSGAWSWHRVIPLLVAAGRTVVPVELPAHGADRGSVAGASLAAYGERVDAALDAASGPVVLVGHNMAGAVISMAAEARPEKVATLVYLSAYLLAAGQSIFDLAGMDSGSALGPILHVDEAAGVVSLDEAGFVDAFFHDCDPATRELGRALLTPEPVGPLATPIAVTAAGFGSVRKVYVSTTGDRVVSPELQAQMVATTPCDEVIELDAGHASYLSRPEELAAILTAR